jgi:streptogramin lyase
MRPTTVPDDAAVSTRLDLATIAPVTVTDEVTTGAPTLVNLRVSSAGAVYARELDTARVVRLDPSDGAELASVELPRGVDEFGRVFYEVAAGSLWATIPQTGVIHELDPDTLEIRRQIELPTAPVGNYWTHESASPGRRSLPMISR